MKPSILISEPAQPPQNQWKFIDDLRLPEPRVFDWNRTTARDDEANLSRGISLVSEFPDPSGLLETAFKDLDFFFRDAGIRSDGPYQIMAAYGEAGDNDSFRLQVEPDSCKIVAGNIEGIRRGLFYLEDQLRGSTGPFLKIGSVHQVAWIKNRISRCFFGPIKRPPLNRDEHMDAADYYPEAYLNRLAHEGVNGLWLTINFSDLCKTSITPEYGADAHQRLAKLKRTVDQCLRYGIKIYIFCIEPAAWKAGSPILKRHPELGGAIYMGDTCFCPFSDTAQQYLYEAVNGIFKAVPGLGGMINITHGERLTTCLSTVPATEEHPADCPVCSGRKHWEIIHASISAMEKGMRAAAPEAQLISWLYMPPPKSLLADWVFEIPSHVPENVILQFNFESGGVKEQLGKPRVGGDYWLSYVGPSESFRKIAQSTLAAESRLSAKIQVGCSHEVATIPFVPVPGLLYRKYQKMRKFGVSSVMQCWHFGNYPGTMNKAAGMLASEEFKNGEADFLKRLALPDWGRHADAVVSAWMAFADGYSNYPLSNAFQYYGPMHDGVVWPLHLYPVNTPLAPTWKLEYGTSGDYIGECLENHTLDEAVLLCTEMSEKWNAGVGIFKNIRPDFADNPARLQDIGLAEALGIQLESGSNILRFYALREELFSAPLSQKEIILDELESIVHGEIRRSERMAELCDNDSRLGFHSEAEGYKYFPEKLQWRVNLLKEMLRDDFPLARTAIAVGKLVLPDTGTAPVAICGSGKYEQCETFQWKADQDRKSLLIEIQSKILTNPPPDSENIFLTISRNSISFPLSLEIIQRKLFISSKEGCSCDLSEQGDEWTAKIAIPHALLDHSNEPLNISLIRLVTNRDSIQYLGWGGDMGPQKYRLKLGIYNPAFMGKLIFS